MKSITAKRRHREMGNILSNNAKRRDRILFSIAARRRREAKRKLISPRGGANEINYHREAPL
jgi:hypothetical protein